MKTNVVGFQANKLNNNIFEKGTYYRFVVLENNYFAHKGFILV